MKNALLIIISTFGLFLTSCNYVEDKKSAQTKIENLLDSRISSNTMIPDSEYSTEFMKSTSLKDWENIKKFVLKANGNLKGYSLKGWHSNKIAQTGKLSGTFIKLQYNMEYEKGTGVETIIMHKAQKEDPFKILNHHFVSKEIQELKKEGLEKAVEN